MSCRPTVSRLASVPLAVLLLTAGVLGQSTDATWRQVSPGVEHAKFTRATAGLQGATGPWPINLLRVDPAVVDLDVVRAMDEAVGLETVSSLAARFGAIAAINGGYFRATGTYRGNSTGLLQIDKTVLSESDRGHAALGILRIPTSGRLVIGHVDSDASVMVDGKRRLLNGINRPRGDDEIIVFTPEFHRTTLTGPDGLEVVVRRGVVEAVREGSGSTPIPPDGIVLSAKGTGRQWLREHARPGVPAETAVVVKSADRTPQELWDHAEDIVAAGPMIVSAGRVEVMVSLERMSPAFSTDRSPRTAVGVLADGRALFATVDGRRPPLSVGMTLDELARLMVEFGAIEAMNLDGGGSTTMVVDGKMVNTPSDAAGERPVSDAIVIRARR